MPFSGLTVVDLGTLNAAPQIAAFFGDFGARVIKVESPRGDGLRRMVDPAGRARQWELSNRNKECVTVDVRRAEGRALLDRLLARADLLVCGLSADRLQRFGLEAAKLHADHPRLVVVNLTAFGTEGPWARRPGSGTLAEAATGLAHLTGPADAPPTLSPVGLGDYMGVLHGIIAALMGLHARRGSPSERGEFFDVAMFEPLLGLLSQRLAAFSQGREDPGRHGNRFTTMAPRNTYRTQDGSWVALTAGTDELVRRTLSVIGRPELAEDVRFRDHRSRLANADELDAMIGGWIAGHSRDRVVEAFADAGVSLAAVDDFARVVDNPHFRARADLVEVDDGHGGTMTTAAPTPHRKTDPGRVRWLGRSLGEDNRSVWVDWLGLPPAELERLEAEGVV